MSVLHIVLSSKFFQYRVVNLSYANCNDLVQVRGFDKIFFTAQFL